MKNGIVYVPVFVAVLCAFTVAGDVAAEYESVVFGVDRFSGDLYCGGSELSFCVDSADKMDRGFELIYYDQTRWFYDHGVDGRDWTDPIRYSWGRDYVDPYGTDFADAAAIISHGTRCCGNCAQDYGYWSMIVMGDTNEDCNIYTNNYKTSISGSYQTPHMRFGGNPPSEELNVLIMATCQSMHKCVWDHNGYSHMDNGGESLRIINGYHGISTDAWYIPNDYKYYVRFAKYNGLGDDWMDKLTQYDDCATSLVWGSSRSKRDKLFDWGGFKDLKDTGVHTHYTTYWIGGCNPSGGITLPD